MPKETPVAPQGQPVPGPRQEIKIVDNIPGAEYANMMQLGSPNKDEFHLNFATISGGSGRVVAKVITNPGHLKRMAAVLNDVIKNYEEKFGKIEEAPEFNKEIGFKE
jgi:hypothetical protein